MKSLKERRAMKKTNKLSWKGFVGGDGQLVGGTIIAERKHWLLGKQYRIIYGEDYYLLSGDVIHRQKVKWVNESLMVFDN